ncbi:hypothetical protein UPYG_G00153230 [Umbra pygmaea]|uniref:Caspase 2, apoptosis-related cysteine peptidase n=1 Tax=Umbra pygmaea TaxID=75934 RepID=A0ABD0WYQ2_UMBPY
MLGEYCMLERDKRALKKNSTALCKDMVVDEMLIQCLQQDDILTDSMAENILAKPTSQNRSWNLLLLLPKRGPRAFKSFCSALRNTEQQHLCALLAESLKRDSGTSEQDSEKYTDPHLPLSTEEEMVIPKRPRTHESMEVCLDADSPITTAVLPCTQDFYRSHFQQSYSMTSSPRGLGLVISNVNFDPRAAPDLDRRTGGEVDEEVLRKVFTELDYIVTVHRNLSAQAMRACIEGFSRRQLHQTRKCLLSFFTSSFYSLHCSKPSSLCVPAEEMDCGVEQCDGPERTQSPGCEQRDAGREECGDATPTDQRGRLRVKLPQRSDMICGFASLKGTAAMRNTKKGSWFIQELNSALRLRAKDTHLSDILVQVNGRIKDREGYAPGTPHHRCKEMSEFTSSLCKDLYLFPKYLPQY